MKKDFVIINSERFMACSSEVISDMINSLRKSAQETGMDDRSFIGETLLLTMFSAKLENRIMNCNDDTDNTTENNDNTITL